MSRLTRLPPLHCDNGSGYGKSVVYLLIVCAIALVAYWYLGTVLPDFLRTVALLNPNR